MAVESLIQDNRVDPEVSPLSSMYCGFWVKPNEIRSRSISMILGAKSESFMEGLK